LFQEFGTLRIWSAGCSIGAEPYSLSILLEELDPKTPHRILATDVDVKALEVAKAGIYNEDKLKEVSSQRLRRFFTREEADKWRVAPEIKRRVRFQVHDLLKDPRSEERRVGKSVNECSHRDVVGKSNYS